VTSTIEVNPSYPRRSVFSKRRVEHLQPNDHDQGERHKSQSGSVGTSEERKEKWQIDAQNSQRSRPFEKTFIDCV
jgi:hypothetical protein